MTRNKTLIIGGYGMVGKKIASILIKEYSRQVVISGRNYSKALEFSQELGERAQPLQLDVFDSKSIEKIPDDVSLVVMCLDQMDTFFVEACLRKGINYIDITANTSFILKLAEKKNLAISQHASALLSVGLAPGLTNLLAKQVCNLIPNVEQIDIFIMLGLGEAHGKAAIQWTLDHINSEFTILDRGFEKRVNSFENYVEADFPVHGKRKAYRFDFPEQRIIPNTLGIQTVSSWLCFDIPMMTTFYAMLKKIKVLQLLQNPKISKWAVRLLQNFQIGSESFSKLSPIV
jgi:saccharopine dehydrogenase-like NADP-dependent oxidoreductase